jgi:hypothetical protein
MIANTIGIQEANRAPIQGVRSKVLTGVTGEYFVAAELSRRGYIASITLRNTKGVDILCSNSDASKSAGIHVKTQAGMERSWILSQKGESYYADHLFYVFVNISEEAQQYPDFTVVPSKVVADYIRTHHEECDRPPLSSPGGMLV